MATRRANSPLASPHLARLVASEAEPGPETRATRRASVGRPALVHERGGSLALVSEASNDVASPRLVCLAIHSVTYKYFAQGEMHAFRTLRSPCHQRPQRPLCPHWPPCPIGRRVPLAAVSPIGAGSANGTAGSPNAAAVSPNGRHVTHHRVSLTASASLTAPASPTTGCH